MHLAPRVGACLDWRERPTVTWPCLGIALPSHSLCKSGATDDCTLGLWGTGAWSGRWPVSGVARGSVWPGLWVWPGLRVWPGLWLLPDPVGGVWLIWLAGSRWEDQPCVIQCVSLQWLHARATSQHPLVSGQTGLSVAIL